MKNIVSILTASAAGLVLASAAFAADLPSKAPVVAAPAAAAPSLDNTLSFEFSPEFRANNPASSNNSNNGGAGKTTGAVVDDYAKIAYSHTFMGTWVVGGMGQWTDRVGNGGGSQVAQSEINVGYKWKVLPSLTITPGAGVGYLWGTPKVAGQCWNVEPCPSMKRDDGKSVSYYFFTLNADWKIDSNWTWNVIGLRYRDAFSFYWNTPKVSTGVTYNFSPADAVYVSGGMAWKDKNSHSVELSSAYEDKYNVAIGYKRSF